MERIGDMNVQRLPWAYLPASRVNWFIGSSGVARDAFIDKQVSGGIDIFGGSSPGSGRTRILLLR